MCNFHSKAAVVSLTLVLVTGCSFGFIYRQLDWLVPWYVNDYITLNASQHNVLEKRVIEQLDWHCRTQLSSYAAWFEQLHANPRAFSRSQLEQHYRTTREYWRILMERVAADASQVLVSASESQLDELLNNLDNNNRKLEKEYAALTNEQREKQREERMLRLLERWLGDITTMQHQQIKGWSAAIGSEGDSVWMAERRKWQQLLIDAIRRHDEADAMAKDIRVLLVEPETLWSEQYRSEYQRRLDLTLDMLAVVASNVTPLQRAHLDRELLSWADKFESLSCVGEATG